MGWRNRGYGRYGGYGMFRPYVPVAKRRADAQKFALALAKKEKRNLTPVQIEGRKIATTFWGQAWMDNLERYSDFDNRLPRGRTYVRNGSVIDLTIGRGLVKAIVSGSEIYQVEVNIGTLASAVWKKIKNDCAHSIDSLIDLLSGKFDNGVMQRLTRTGDGLFPQPAEIKMKCSCPDYATLCKHVAAVLYGVGARLDTQPELLFTLRDVDHTELIQQATTGKNLDRMLTTSKTGTLGGEDLGELFGIELEQAGDSAAEKFSGKKRVAKPPRKRLTQTARRGKAPPERPESARSKSRPAAKKVGAKTKAAKPTVSKGRTASKAKTAAKAEVATAAAAKPKAVAAKAKPIAKAASRAAQRRRT